MKEEIKKHIGIYSALFGTIWGIPILFSFMGNSAYMMRISLLFSIVAIPFLIVFYYKRKDSSHKFLFILILSWTLSVLVFHRIDGLTLIFFFGIVAFPIFFIKKVKKLIHSIGKLFKNF